MNDDEKARLLIEAWKTTVDVQKHFNDLAMRIRAFALSFLGVVVGASAVAIQQKLPVLARGLALVGVLAWLAFLIMDALWYHQLLKGSVVHGEKIEKKIKDQIGLDGFDLTQAITESSHWKVAGKDALHSTGKLRLFYTLGFVFMGVLFGSTYWVKPATVPVKADMLNIIISADSSHAGCTPLRVIIVDSMRKAPGRQGR